MTHDKAAQLSKTDCALVLIAAFLGWLFAGVQLAVSSLVMRDAARSLLGTADEAVVGQWFGWLITAFLLGAATGGYCLGWVGDRIGRSRAMALSILCYSVFSGLTYFVQTPAQLLALRFLTCLGIGGMWPNGIALVSEAWPNISRPLLAGVIGTAANVGIMLLSVLLCFVYVTPDEWRWVTLFGTSPVVLGLAVFWLVPESPRWLAIQQRPHETRHHRASLMDVFRPPVLKTTVVGIMLGTVPLFGGWGSTNWANAWASQVGERDEPGEGETEQGTAAAGASDAKPALKAKVLLARSLPGSIASLLGGALAVLVGRKACYFLLSLAALFCSQYLFRFLHPADPQFLVWTAALGLFSGFFFGWLPLCLPEMFATGVRATGAGVSFNFGRIVTAFGVLVAAGALKRWFEGDYATIGQYTSFIYAVGMVVIFFAPDASGQQLQD